MDGTNHTIGQGGAKVRLIARIAMVVAAIALVAAFFLPWASADAEYREAAAQLPDVMYYEPTGLTAADAADLSLFEYAQVYGSMEDSPWVMYQYIIFAGLAIAAFALALATWGKPIGAAVFAILILAFSRLMVWDFSDRGVLPNSTHDWGIASTVFVIGSIALIVASIWLFVLKRQEKAANRD